MNKKNDHNISTERILKSKYLDKEKQKTIPLIHKSNKKIKLTDLCPEEKLKVGELIMTLEERKLENQRITAECHELNCKYQECLQMLEALQTNIQEKQQELKRAATHLQTKQQKIQKQEGEIIRLEEELAASQEIAEKNNKKCKNNIQIQTDIFVFVDQSVQTKTKKRKSKDAETQADITEPNTIFYRAHSKSFDKIMKGTVPFPDRCTTRPVHEFTTTENALKPSYANSQLKDKSELRDKSSPKVNNFQEEAEECVEQLAQRWKQIRQKSEKGKKTQPPFFSTKPFAQRSYVMQQSDEDDESVDQQSLQKRAGEGLSIEDYDQRYLNKLLRLKNFSANKLFNGCSSLSKDSSKKYSPQISYLKSPYFNDKEPYFKENRESGSQECQGSTNRGINFFQSDILELAQRINL